MSLIGTSSFASSTGTSAVSTNSQDLTSVVDSILFDDGSQLDDSSVASSRFAKCIKKYKRRCLNSYSVSQCRVILTRYCKKVVNQKPRDHFRYCIKSNLKRCLTHYSVPQCRKLLTNACSLTKDKELDHKCVKKNAHRCALSMLTRKECKEKLEAACSK